MMWGVANLELARHPIFAEQLPELAAALPSTLLTGANEVIE